MKSLNRRSLRKSRSRDALRLTVRESVWHQAGEACVWGVAGDSLGRAPAQGGAAGKYSVCRLRFGKCALLLLLVQSFLPSNNAR
ncbi:MAG: hypothetical protein LBH75_01295 [Treponema sp.]|nr:hypothetical protein [Treponema sp.]